MLEMSTKTDEKSLQNMEKYLHGQVKEEIEALSNLVRAGYLTTEQIQSIPLRNLRELAARVAVKYNEKRPYLVFPFDVRSPNNRLEKFRTIAGITPEELRVKIDASKLAFATNEAILEYNKYRLTHPKVQNAGPRARIAAVVYNGSHFQPGKTPSIYSDLDCEVVYRNDGLLNTDLFQYLMLEPKLKSISEMEIEPTGKIISDYISDAQEYDIDRNTTVAEPYRQHSIFVASSKDSLVASPYQDDEILKLRQVVSQMPYNLSEYPSDHHRFPSVSEWERIGFTMTSQSIADQVAEKIAKVTGEVFTN